MRNGIQAANAVLNAGDLQRQMQWPILCLAGIRWRGIFCRQGWDAANCESKVTADLK
jgi:hypothetical protein